MLSLLTTAVAAFRSVATPKTSVKDKASRPLTLEKLDDRILPAPLTALGTLLVPPPNLTGITINLYPGGSAYNRANQLTVLSETATSSGTSSFTALYRDNQQNIVDVVFGQIATTGQSGGVFGGPIDSLSFTGTGGAFGGGYGELVSFSGTLNSTRFSTNSLGTYDLSGTANTLISFAPGVYAGYNTYLDGHYEYV